MAIHNPAGLYSEGQGIFNSTPYTQFALHKQAKEEALDKYYADLPKTINSAGMRVKDIPGYMSKINGIRTYYQQNKDKIKNPRLDNGKAQSEYQSMNTDASMDVAKSKDRGARTVAAGEFREGRLKTDQRLPEDFEKDLAENDKSIYENTDYKGLDIGKWAQTIAPPFQQDKFRKEFIDIKPQVAGISHEKVLDNPLQLIEVTKSTFTPEQKEIIKARAAQKYNDSFSFSDSVIKDLKDPVKSQELDRIYQENYGELPKNKEEYATAKALQLLQTDLVSKKPVVNQEEIDRRKKADEEARDQRNFNQSKILQDIAHANSKKLIDYREKAQQGGTVTNNLWVDSYLNNIEEDAVKNTSSFSKIASKFKVNLSGGKVEPDPVLYKALGEPDLIMLTPDKKYKVTFYKVNADKTISDEIDQSKSGTFTRDQVKLALGYKATGKPQLTKEMNNKSKPKKDTLGILE